MKPNVILITVDQMRGDCIGALGHPDIHTPFLDTMLNHGAACTSAYSATPTCIPARVALFTGLSQSAHGRVGYQDCVEWDYTETLPKAFADAGYHTQCIGKMHVWPPRKLMGFHDIKLHDGFLPHRGTTTPANTWWDRIDDYMPYLRAQAGYQADIADTGIDCNSWVAKSWPLPEHTHPTNWTVTETLNFLKRRDPTKPFFAWTSFVAPHPPFVPPLEYLQMYQNKPLAAPAKGEWSKEIGNEHPDMDCFEGKLSPEEIQQMQAGYYGLITHLDHQIGRLLRALKDERLLQNTIVLFTSDHGEMLGDHNMFRKNQAFEGSVKVPFLLYDPGKLLGLAEGAQVDALAELRDVFPTLADAAGVPIPAGVEGFSLLPALRKGETAAPVREYLHGEHTAQQRPTQSAHYIATQQYKFIWHSDSGKEFLFDVKADPKECVNLANCPAHAETLAILRGHLIAELTGREEGYTDGKVLIAGKTPQTMLQHPLPVLSRR